MSEFDRLRPIGERVAALETEVPGLARRQQETNDKLDDLTDDMKIVLAALERRSATLRVAGWAAETGRTIVTALLAGIGLHFLSEARQLSPLSERFSVGWRSIVGWFVRALELSSGAVVGAGANFLTQ